MLRHSRIALHVQQHVINRARNDFRNGRSEQQNVTFISKHLDEGDQSKNDGEPNLFVTELDVPINVNV
jgi:hypothetical protein